MGLNILHHLTNIFHEKSELEIEKMEKMVGAEYLTPPHEHRFLHRYFSFENPRFQYWFHLLFAQSTPSRRITMMNWVLCNPCISNYSSFQLRLSCSTSPGYCFIFLITIISCASILSELNRIIFWCIFMVPLSISISRFLCILYSEWYSDGREQLGDFSTFYVCVCV